MSVGCDARLMDPASHYVCRGEAFGQDHIPDKFNTPNDPLLRKMTSMRL